MLSTCLDCGLPTDQGTRCKRCRAVREEHRNANRPHYSGQWQQLSKAQREAVPYCEDCGATDDLTADHVIPRSLEAGLRTLCRSCNSSKQDKR